MTPCRLSTCVLIALLASQACAGSVALAQERENRERPALDSAKPLSLDDYEVLIRRNIFAHEQPKPPRANRRNGEGSNGDEAPKEVAKEVAKDPGPKAEADIVLVGAVQRDGQSVAFLEDRRAGKLLSVKPGDKLGSGTVGTITVNGMEFIAGDKTLTVLIGNNLEGGASTAKPVEALPVTNDPKADADAASMLEQMKRRRQKELGK